MARSIINGVVNLAVRRLKKHIHIKHRFVATALLVILLRLHHHLGDHPAIYLVTKAKPVVLAVKVALYTGIANRAVTI